MELNDINPGNAVRKDLTPMDHSLLMELFEHELKGTLWAEKELTFALPKMADNATAPELKEALNHHLKETRTHVEKLERVFELLGKPATEKKCPAMEGLVKAGDEVMLSTLSGPQRDAAIIGSAQKVEHYEISTYGTLKHFANTLGLDDVAILLGGILEEEKNADTLLNEIALSGLNKKAL